MERFVGPKDDLYTAVNKPFKKKPQALPPKTGTDSYTKLSDLNVNHNSAATAAATVATAEVVGDNNNNDNNKRINVASNQLSYSEVSLDQRPELEPATRRDSAIDDDMWVTVKWNQKQEKLQQQQQKQTQQQQQKQKQQQKQQQHSELERSIEDDHESIALSLLGGGDLHQGQIPLQDYTNLTDINTGQAFVGEMKRSEEDSNKIYIEGNSLVGNSNFTNHEYINQDTDDGKEEQLVQHTSNAIMYSEIEDVNEIVRKLDEKKSKQNGPLASVPPTSDYVNTVPSPTSSKVLYRDLLLYCIL